MEHPKETKGEPKSKDKELVFNPLIGAEGSNRSVLTALSASTCSELPGTSNYSYGDRLEAGFSNRHVTSVKSPEIPLANHPPITDAGNVVKEFARRDAKIPNSASVSSMNDVEEAICRLKGQWQNFYSMAGRSRSRNLSGGSVSQDKGGMLLSSEEGINERKSLVKQKITGLDGVSSCLKDGSNKLISSNQQPDGGDRSKVLYSSSFTKFFVKQTHKDKGGKCKDPEPHREHHSIAMSQPAAASVKFSEASVYPMGTKGQPSSHSMSKLGPISSHGKISLREWLNSGASEVKKAERLHIFRQIVQLVDEAHLEGIVLTDLRPSKFIFASPNSIKYTGSFAPAELKDRVNQAVTEKRPSELDMQDHGKSGLKQQKLGKDMELTRQSQFISTYGNFSEAIRPRSQLEAGIAQLEKMWYASPEKLDGSGLLSSNIYSLGVLLFELLYHYKSLEVHSSEMLDLHDRILPANFLSQNHKEAGFCFWLLHPQPSSRPSTREILQSEAIYSPEDVLVGDDTPSLIDKEEDMESDLLLDFLASLKEQKQNYISSLLENIKCLEADIKEVGKSQEPVLYSEWRDKGLTTEVRNMVEKNLNLMKNISQLENAYFSLKSKAKLATISSEGRSDTALLSNRERWHEAQTADSNVEEKQVDQAVAFLQGIHRFVRYSKFQVCGTLWNGDLLNSTNVICSLSFDRDEDYIAAAEVSKKIKIFEFKSLLNASLDIQYSMVEMSNKSKLSCVCWNQYIQNYLASTDYDGVVQMWDASTGQPFAQYIEHEKRAWSVDFSRVDPAKFASGSDDCSVKLWSITQRNSTGTIWNPANVCCVQFSSYSSYLLAFGSADYKIYCYDLRHTRIPWCSLAGHGKAVSYVKFLDSETLVSASTDNTLKLWDLKNSSIEGPVSSACSLTSSGHTNEKNFVGLSVFDGYIACGSETNEVFAYYRSLPMPITSHKFGSVDPISGHEIDESNGQFVSSVCWRRKSGILVAANSSGNIKLLQLV